MLKKSQNISVVLLITMAMTNISCGQSSAVTHDSTAAIESETTVEAETSYRYPELDLDGKKITILSNAPIWDFYAKIDVDDMNGESLNDAIYERNRMIEDKLNIDIDVKEVDINSLSKTISTNVLAGDTAYDAAYCQLVHVGGLITSGCLNDIRNYDGISFESPWWDQNIISDCGKYMSGQQFFMSSNLHPMSLNALQCIFFNATILENNSIPYPYDTVKNGKWTFDELKRLTALTANLNGSDSYAWNADNSVIYGFTSYQQAVTSFVYASGITYLDSNGGNGCKFSLNTERFYNICERIAKLVNTEGEYLYANDVGTAFQFEQIFVNQRAAFALGEIKAADLMRNMDNGFGILPLPKYDENQENYISTTIQQFPLLCIPATNTDYDTLGYVLDALSYASYTDVMPVLYDKTISQKRLRDEASIDMLHIISANTYFDCGRAYGWTNSLVSEIEAALLKGESNMASLIAKYKTSIDTLIADTYGKR